METIKETDIVITLSIDGDYLGIDGILGVYGIVIKREVSKYYASLYPDDVVTDEEGHSYTTERVK